MYTSHASRRPRPLSAVTALFAATLCAGCGGGADTGDEAAADGDACAAARAHVEACFPGETSPADDTCNAAAARQISATSCEGLGSLDTKADGGYACLFAPWLCLAGGGGSSGGGSGSADGQLEVAVNTCMGSFTDDCAGVTSAPCSLVVVEQGGREVARAYTSTGGRATFDDLKAGDYDVRVLTRANRVAKILDGDLALRETTAVRQVTLGRETVWADFNLTAKSQEATQACSRLIGTVDVTTASGEPADRHAVEWDFLVRLENADGSLDLTRPFFTHHEATESGDDENRLGFDALYAGEYTVSFIPVQIPESQRRNNPDYEALFDRYAIEGVDPVAFTVKVDKSDLPDDLALSFDVEDPVAR